SVSGLVGYTPKHGTLIDATRLPEGYKLER
ncbi:hypothetical protein A2U01_0069120, partial [Trifolium medium]|nr:hypothetical protein [Trifolium medium]